MICTVLAACLVFSWHSFAWCGLTAVPSRVLLASRAQQLLILAESCVRIRRDAQKISEDWVSLRPTQRPCEVSRIGPTSCVASSINRLAFHRSNVPRPPSSIFRYTSRQSMSGWGGGIEMVSALFLCREKHAAMCAPPCTQACCSQLKNVNIHVYESVSRTEGGWGFPRTRCP